MRSALAGEKIDIVAWVHLPTLMFFLFGMRVARTQIFISQYLHPDIAHLDIDGLITYGTVADKTGVYLNDRWRLMPSALEIDKTEFADLQDCRCRYADADTLIMATFGRMEKIRQPGFLHCVAKVLAATERSIYLYSGYKDDPALVDFFNERNLADRVKFVGWVDVDRYVQIADLVLDSFPIATGITALKAMQYSTPVLSMGNAYSYVGRDVRPILEQDEFKGFSEAEATCADIKRQASALAFLPYALTEADYVAQAVELIGNAERRRDLARFQHFCMERLYLDNCLMGGVFAQHLNEIMTKSRQRFFD